MCAYRKAILFFIYALFALQILSSEARPLDMRMQQQDPNGRRQGGSMPAQESVVNKNDDINYPFTESAAQIAPDNVAGIRIRKDPATGAQSVTYIDYNRSCYVEKLANAFDFSKSDFFKKYKQLCSVEFNGIELSEENLENLQKFLPKSLKSLIILSCKIQSSNYELICDMIRKRSKLESACFRLLEAKDVDSDALLQSLSDCESLKFLKLEFGSVSTKGCENIAKIIEKTGGNLLQLSLGLGQLSGDQDISYQKITTSLHNAKVLEKFEIATSDISDANARILFETIENLTALRQLKLYCGGLNNHNHIKLFENMEKLRDSIEKLHHLHELDISNLQLPPEALQLLFQAIGQTKSLKTLNVSGNCIDEKAAESLSESLKEVELTALFANNCQINATAFATLTKNMANSTIQYLHLINNSIKNGIRNMPIATMHELKLVDFSKNELLFEDVFEFIKQCKSNLSLKIIRVQDNGDISSAQNTERTMRNDQIAAWKIKNKMDHLAIFGL